MNIEKGLTEAKGIWAAFQDDRLNKLKLGVRLLGNAPPFRAAVETGDPPTILELFKDLGVDLGADFIIITDPDGLVVARSDRAGAQGEDLSKDPIVMKPLGGEESATVWRQADKLFHAVSVPIVIDDRLVGVLVAGYAIGDAVASQIQKLSHSDVAFLTHAPGQPPELSVSSLGRAEDAFRTALADPQLATGGTGTTFPLDLGGERFFAVQVPLVAATKELVGSVVALRSVAEETASFRQFRNSLVLVSLVVMALGLVVAYFASRQITGPVRTLVNLVERVRDGSYSGAVTVNTKDEIGILARSFNHLLADLRDKDQMIGFLREGMTLMKGTSGETAADVASAATTNLQATTAPTGASTGKLEKGSLFAHRYEVLNVVEQYATG